jgi:hypothetical protein
VYKSEFRVSSFAFRSGGREQKVNCLMDDGGCRAGSETCVPGSSETSEGDGVARNLKLEPGKLEADVLVAVTEGVGGCGV